MTSSYSGATSRTYSASINRRACTSTHISYLLSDIASDVSVVIIYSPWPFVSTSTAQFTQGCGYALS
ncbi:MAG: hypothetical protein HQM15_01165 [Deltaproteobacteria bacterium]|nr:hypothetical protein [Deltaproteobacteria bacterium]